MKIQKLNRLSPVAAALAAGLMLTGCAYSVSPNQVSRYETGVVNGTETGTLVAARNVTITGTRSGLGTGAGAVAGGLAGSQIGGDGVSNALGAIGGALLGGLLGTAIEEGTTQRYGVEYTIRGDDGRTITVVQGADTGPLIAPGERVLLIYSPERVRVVPEPYQG